MELRLAPRTLVDSLLAAHATTQSAATRSLRAIVLFEETGKVESVENRGADKQRSKVGQLLSPKRETESKETKLARPPRTHNVVVDTRTHTHGSCDIKWG